MLATETFSGADRRAIGRIRRPIDLAGALLGVRKVAPSRAREPVPLVRPSAATFTGDAAGADRTFQRSLVMSLVLSWLILSLAVWITALILPGFHVKGFGSAILVAALFGILNFLLGWLFFAVFTIATLGLALLLAFITRWIINAIILKITDALTDRLRIDGFGWALLGALMMSALGTIGEWVIRAAL